MKLNKSWITSFISAIFVFAALIGASIPSGVAFATEVSSPEQSFTTTGTLQIKNNVGRMIPELDYRGEITWKTTLDATAVLSWGKVAGQYTNTQKFDVVAKTFRHEFDIDDGQLYYYKIDAVNTPTDPKIAPTSGTVSGSFVTPSLKIVAPSITENITHFTTLWTTNYSSSGKVDCSSPGSTQVITSVKSATAFGKSHKANVMKSFLVEKNSYILKIIGTSKTGKTATYSASVTYHGLISAYSGSEMVSKRNATPPTSGAIFTWRTLLPATGTVTYTGPSSGTSICSVSDYACTVSVGGLKPGTYKYIINATATDGSRKGTVEGQFNIAPFNVNISVQSKPMTTAELKNATDTGTWPISWKTNPSGVVVKTASIAATSSLNYYDYTSNRYSYVGGSCPTSVSFNGIGSGLFNLTVCSQATYKFTGQAALADGSIIMLGGNNSASTFFVGTPSVISRSVNGSNGFKYTLSNSIAYPQFYPMEVDYTKPGDTTYTKLAAAININRQYSGPSREIFLDKIYDYNRYMGPYNTYRRSLIAGDKVSYNPWYNYLGAAQCETGFENTPYINKRCVKSWK